MVPSRVAYKILAELHTVNLYAIRLGVVLGLGVGRLEESRSSSRIKATTSQDSPTILFTLSDL